MKLQCQKLEYEFPVVKEEIDGQIPQAFDRGLQFEDRIYMKVSFIFPFFIGVIYEDLWLFADL